jgi:predicted CxxxxCH...CXXCH cytochrome family protein
MVGGYQMMMIYSRLNVMCRVMPYCQGIPWCSVEGKSLWWGLLLVRWEIMKHNISCHNDGRWEDAPYEPTVQWHVLQNGMPACEVIPHLHKIDALLTGLWKCICVCRLWSLKLQHGNWLAIIFIRLRMLTTCRYANLLIGPTHRTKNSYNL